MVNINSTLKLSILVTVLNFVSGCGDSEKHKEIQFPNDAYAIPEPEPEPEVPVEFSEVTVTSLKALANFPIGVAVPAGNASNSLMSSSDRQDLVIQHFSQLTAENIMKMDAMQPAQDDFTWLHADELLDYAEDNELTVHGHVLVWHSQIPDWMREFDGDQSAWVTMMENHVTQIATRYAGRLETWDVVNEAFNEDGSYRGSAAGDDSVWYTNIGESFIEKAFIAARAADADVDLYYNDYNISWNGPKLDGIIAMAADFQARDIPIDGIGFQMHVSADGPNKATFIRQLQKIVDLGLKVKITELDLRMNETKDKTFTPEVAELQKKRYFDLVSAYLETVPASQRGGVSVWGLIDGDSWLEDFWGAVDWPLMFNDDYTPKPALQGFADALATEDTDGADGADNIVVDFEDDSTAYTVVGDPDGSAVVSEDPTDATKEALKVSVVTGNYASGVAMPVYIPAGKTLADYSAVTFKVYYTVEGAADITNKRIQLFALSGDLPDSLNLIQWDGTWADNATDAHLGVMDNAKAETTESTDFQTYTFDLTDGNVEDLVDGSTLADATKTLTGDINIVFAFPHSGSVVYIDDLTLVAVE